MKQKIKITWLDKILLKFWPFLAMKHLAKKMKIKNPIFDQAHALFTKVDRIDLMPSRSEERGFIIILDRQTALYFYQDGDRFIYDGFEMGEYDKGDVTIFDQIKK